MTSNGGGEQDPLGPNDLARRTVLKATGGAAALSVGTGSVAGAVDGESAVEQVGTAGVKNVVDPVFGFAAMGPNPCAGTDGTDCLGAFPEPIRPAARVDMHIEIPEVLFAVAEAGGLSNETTAAINEAVADGSLTGDDLPDGGTQIDGEQLSVTAVAEALVDTAGFHFDPAGLRVQPGDVVLFNAESPDHGVAAFHQRHGRQNRVPAGVGPLSAPLVPVGGFWLAQFDTEGVYDLYCPPHGVFGMVMRVVVWDGDGSVPQLDIGPPGRPPEEENALPSIVAGLNPNVPSSAAALESQALTPENVVDQGTVGWQEVVTEYRTT
ncbi:cupredoxin domain-containing protein [Salinigranum marinum]|uniref:cupredoxin domain-containing protein n=1 Tax=Salinigranum marinum TaxID=1515595 RepID=UPI002989C9FD|nr:plastocyanin/azurin family copper-binding protein [Salinigranum marinum]